MRLRASYTVENSIIIPLFTIIIVLMINLVLYIHDSLIVSDAQLRAAIHIEQEDVEKNSDRENQILQNMTDYIEKKAIVSGDNAAKYRQEFAKKQLIDKNRPVEFVRAVSGFVNKND